MPGLLEEEDSQQEWVSFGDLMSALALLFIIISLVALSLVPPEPPSPTVDPTSGTIIVPPGTNTECIDRGNERRCTITRDTLNGDELFEQGSDLVTPVMKQTLNSLWPQLIEWSLEDGEHEDKIESIIIEGHTNSDWGFNDRPDNHPCNDLGLRDTLPECLSEAYMGNMKLSQGRAANVMSYVLELGSSRTNWNWLKPKLSAAGFGYRNLKMTSNNEEDVEKSRRVEIRMLLRDSLRFENSASNTSSP